MNSFPFSLSFQFSRQQFRQIAIKNELTKESASGICIFSLAYNYSRHIRPSKFHALLYLTFFCITLHRGTFRHALYSIFSSQFEGHIWPTLFISLKMCHCLPLKGHQHEIFNLWFTCALIHILIYFCHLLLFR